MTALHLARRVRELLSEPGRWTQGAYARTAAGTPCSSTAAEAVCWCLRGALSKAAHGEPSKARYELRQQLDAATLVPTWEWNDRRSTRHADVLALLDRVIARMERE